MDDEEPKPLHPMNTIHDHCIKVRNSLLQNAEVMPECKMLIRDEPLPPVVNPIAFLERLEQTV